MIYFDHNATTPVDDRVLEAMLPYLTTFYGNPSSLYRAGRMVRSAIETAREQVAALVGANASQIIFTSGGTEANNLALKGVTANLPVGTVAVSAIEHPSVFETAQALQNQGWQYQTIAVDEQGVFKPTSFDEIFAKASGLLAIMLANNETGAIQPIATLADRLDKQSVILHCDAVQAVGKMAVDFVSLGINSLSISSHKIYGPKGAGALVIDQSLALQPLLTGGGQENSRRAGTENVAAIIGFGKAAELALADLDIRKQHTKCLQQQLQDGLSTIDGLTLFSAETERLANTIQFGIANTDGEMLLMRLDKKGFAVSSGSACASGGGAASHVLMAMGVKHALAKSAVRVSLGQANTSADIDQFLQVLKTLVA